MKPHASGKFGTGTATLVIFDPICLASRIEDTGDWWSIPDEELSEVNAGNVIFARLGCDGGYSFDIYRLKHDEQLPAVGLRAKVRTKMGSFYVGAGEQVIGEDIGPSTQYGGLLFAIPAGNYEVEIQLEEASGHLKVYFKKTDEEAGNDFTDSPALFA
nr:putative integron gene cassette protein [uncultured bacterium]